MSEDQRLHLQFIQNVITRMNSNSASIKSWMVAMVAAFLALYARTGCSIYIFVSIAPVLLFWLFDTYYLWLERKYRKLFTKALNGELQIFNMDASKEKVSFFKTLFRPIECGIYLPIIFVLIIAGVLVSVL